MFQPFMLFEKKYLPRLLNLKRYYFVIQPYIRAAKFIDGVPVTNVLLTEYDNPGLANIHFNAVKNSDDAFFLDIRIDKDFKFFLAMLSGNPLDIATQMPEDKKSEIRVPIKSDLQHSGSIISDNDSVVKRFRVFFNIISNNQEVKTHIRNSYKEQFRQYIHTKTNWSLNRHDTVNVKLDQVEITFGELFVILRWGEQTRRIKFEDIENVIMK